MSPSSEVLEREELNLSPSVREAQRRFELDEPVSAVALAKAILGLHSEYADKKASAIGLDDARDGGTTRPVSAWLQDVRSLFDPSLAPELHGRLVIFGLSLLDSHLRHQLQQDGFLPALEREIKEPVDQILTPKGQALREPPDTVPNHPDDPMQNIEEDQLGRAAFAQYLAKRIFALPEKNGGAYSVHLYGPWGAGKSTLLNFLRAELQRKPEDAAQSARAQGRWLVAEFNAWRHQHIHPPWWALMDTIFRRTKRELRPWQQFQEYWWRFNTGRVPYLIGIAVLAWILVLGVSLFTPETDNLTDMMAFWAANADSVGSILAVMITIWTIVYAANRSFLMGSARAAQNYVESTQDPMNQVKERFKTLIERLKPRRVAIFIDDLDRCQSDYVVELLEGIQTLFREAHVVFVVAADRRWLNACFEEVYDKLEPLVHEPGKPLGTLFLEKAFQFSASVPGMPGDFKKEYWQTLIQIKGGEVEGNLQAARQKAKEMMAKTESEGEIMHAVDRSQDRSFLEQRAIREEAVRRLAFPHIVERTEHVLKPLDQLLDPNPRAMKRLVNAYSVNRALAMLAHVDIERDQLALWTILTMRWPKLADYLEEHPESVALIGQQDIDGVDETVTDLFSDDEVIGVVHTNLVDAGLQPGNIRQCAQLRA